MKIAQVAPLTEAVPPKLYGGTERVVAYLCDALVDLGHDVTLYASGDSKTKAKLVPLWPQALRLDPNVKDYLAPIFMMLEVVARQSAGFDVIHSHLDYFGYSLLRRVKPPFLTTLHGRLDIPELQRLYALYDDVPVISISDSQRRALPHAHYVETIYHGLPSDLLSMGSGRGGYLAFLGRISPEKAPDAAIRIAAAAGMKIRIAAKVDRADQQYFDHTILPLLSQPHVEYIGEISDSQKGDFLGNAAGLLFPIAWEEPFGLVMIEAMACGTPVVAYPCGSVPEVLTNGVTGYIVESEEEAAIAAVKMLKLDRRRIRREFDERFTARHMAENYVRTYQQLARQRANGGIRPHQFPEEGVGMGGVGPTAPRLGTN